MNKKMMISAQPALARIISRVVPANILAKSSETIELSPEVFRFSPAAICLDGEFSRALSSIPTSSLSAQAKMVQDGVHHHQATIAYCLTNATIADGSTYCGLSYSNEAKMKRRPFFVGRYNFYDTLQLSSSIGSEIFFGHWLLDGSCQELIADDRGMGSLIHKRPPRFHEPGYRSLLGLHPIEERIARVDKLWVVDDRGVNDYKLSRFLKIFDRIKKFADLSTDKPQYIFLMRRGGADRNLCNEMQLAETLEKRGFKILDAVNMSSAELVRLFSTAQIVISVEGSHLSHAVLAMPVGGAIITIQPPNRLNLVAYRDFCDAKEIRQAFLIAESYDSGFLVDLNRVLHLVDKVQRVLGQKNI